MITEKHQETTTQVQYGMFLHRLTVNANSHEEHKVFEQKLGLTTVSALRIQRYMQNCMLLLWDALESVRWAILEGI